MSLFNDFHVHLYFTKSQLEQVHHLLEKINDNFKFEIGRIWDRPVGPHPIGSCQITLPCSDFGVFIPWLMKERGVIDVFIHGNTGNDYLDHSKYIMWLGKSYTLDLSIFSRS